MTSTERVQNHREKMRKAGYVRAPDVWIPDTQEAKDKLKAFAKRLRDESK